LNNHRPAPPGLVDRIALHRLQFLRWKARGAERISMPFPYRLPSITRTSIQACGLHDFYYTPRTFTRDVLIDLYMSDGLEKVVIPESHYDVRKTLSAKA
jgi:hypothetical protein